MDEEKYAVVGEESAPVQSAGGPPPGVSGPPPWAKAGAGGPPPGVSGPPPWVKAGAGGPTPGVSGPSQRVIGPADMPEELRAIMPDFPRIRDAYYRLDLIFAGVVFVLEWLMFAVLYLTNGLGRPVGGYLLWYIAVPTAANLFTLWAAAWFNRRMSDQNMRKFTVPIFAMGFMGLILSVTYSSHPIVLGVLFVPIAMTAAFTGMSDPRVPFFSVLSVVLATAKHILTVDTVQDKVRSALEGTVALFLIVLMLRVVATVGQMTGGQRDKLVNFFRSTKSAQMQAEAARMQAEAAREEAEAAREEAEGARVESDAANHAKSEFLANMSHEIRTPINAILGMNEMILRESENEQIREYAGSIHSASTSLLYLVNDVLDFSKIESGKLEIVEVDFDTASFVHDCYSMIAERAEKKGLSMKVECDPGMPAVHHGDEVRCRQVVTNLLSNAVKYTDKGSIRMNVREVQWGDGPAIEVAVKDTGVGIKEENLKSLFSQFVRLDLEKNRNIEGTGLGLTITRQLVELMGGDIKVESVYGEGSTFTVVLPQKISDPTPMGDFHKRYHDVSAKNEKYRQSFEAPSARILVVDDVEVNLKVILNLLKKTKVKVDTAISGYQCLEMAAQRPYDLIFLDHMMPEMNGIETYGKMRAMSGSPNRKTPVVMLTANAVSGVREQYLSEGFADYLSKPVNGDKLEQMILKYLPDDKIMPVTDERADDVPQGPDWLKALQTLWQLSPETDLVPALTRAGSAAALANALTGASPLLDGALRAAAAGDREAAAAPDVPDAWRKAIRQMSA